MSFIAIQVPDIGDIDEVNAIELMTTMGFLVLALEVAGVAASLVSKPKLIPVQIAPAQAASNAVAHTAYSFADITDLECDVLVLGSCTDLPTSQR